MISTKAAIKIPADVFGALDDYHAAVAVALQRKGRVIIEDGCDGLTIASRTVHT
jgi:hypothetical protein